ncbi:pyocin knob domain-containing protein [Priestia abyssalis]|uniref:pyocin knob domain-containing protein n=1 Tax=Priestia abyssalis TaxID=1221450 RepID=UPI0009954A88|nr:pyocin knob domain-containing protein [Priestia abyssalis]
MQYTGNYNLKKPEGTDVVNIQDFNDNADIIDTQLKSLNDTKVTVVPGKGLSTNDYTTTEKNKLAGIAENANNYTHPTSHPAAMITEDSSHRFVTDTEKATWNGKASTAVATPSANGLMSAADKDKLNNIAAGAQVNQNAFSNVKVGTTTVSADSTTDTLELVAGSNIALTLDTANDKVTIATVSGLETTVGSQAKADQAEVNAKAYAMNMVATGSSSDPNTTQEAYILTNHANSPGGGNYWHILTLFYSTKTDNRAQIAVQYNNGTSLCIRSRYGGVWTEWTPIASTSDKVASASKLATPRTIALGGDLSGSASFDGSANLTIIATVADDSHAHVISNIDGLQAALDGKLGTTANAASASKLATARTFTLGGDLMGSVSFDGSANVTLTATVVDGSHNHVISNIDGLQATLDGKLSTAGGAITGSLTVGGSRVLTTADEGTGAGLDADTVDGYHASEFAKATHTHTATDLPSASTSAQGVVQLSTSVSSTSTTTASTSSAVKLAYDKAVSAEQKAVDASSDGIISGITTNISYLLMMGL